MTAINKKKFPFRRVRQTSARIHEYKIKQEEIIAHVAESLGYEMM